MSEARSDLWTRTAIELNHRWLLAYLLAATGNRHRAEDLVQETFETAFRKRDEFEAGRPLGAWLRGIARNLLMQERDKQGRRPRSLSNDALLQVEKATVAVENLHQDTEYEERRIVALRGCVSRLTERARRLVELRYYEGLKVSDIAERTGHGVSNVGMILLRSHALLADCIARRMTPRMAEAR